MDKKTLLNHYKQKYEQAFSDFSGWRERFSDWQRQFEGDLAIEGGSSAKLCYNFTRELIDAQINVDIPQPLVSARRSSDKNDQLARTVEVMLKSELKKLPFEAINDLEERITRIMGGAIFLVEWDNSVSTSEITGGLSVRLLSPLEFIPQPGVFDIERMDYFFLVFEDTKERLYTRYRVNVDGESSDVRVAQPSLTNDRVTQVICYYKNDSGGVGALSWVGDVELFNETEYHVRKTYACAACGAPKTGSACACGSKKFLSKVKNFEVAVNCKKSDGSTLPVKTVTRDKSGNVITQDGLPIVSDTEVPYYNIRSYPVALRKNTSMFGRFFGGSDCETVELLQREANKALSKIDEKMVNSGYIMTKPDSMQFELSNKMGKVLSVSGQDQLQMMKAISFEFDATADFVVLQRCYDMAKSVLGITDTFQGKSDETAISGKAKQLLIEQSAGIQRTKQMLKNAAYSRLYRNMFEFMLAFSDTPRHYSFVSSDGTKQDYIFNRYDFLQQTPDGRWFYQDDFLFDVDQSGSLMSDRQFMLEDMRTDFKLGAFGEQSDPMTLMLYWQEKERLGYPNAGKMAQYWQSRLEQKPTQEGGDDAVQDMQQQAEN